MLTCVRYIHIDTAAAYAASATVVAQKALSQQCVDGDSISISSPVPLKNHFSSIVVCASCHSLERDTNEFVCTQSADTVYSVR